MVPFSRPSLTTVHNKCILGRGAESFWGLSLVELFLKFLLPSFSPVMAKDPTPVLSITVLTEDTLWLQHYHMLPSGVSKSTHGLLWQKGSQILDSLGLHLTTVSSPEGPTVTLLAVHEL